MDNNYRDKVNEMKYICVFTYIEYFLFSVNYKNSN